MALDSTPNTLLLPPYFLLVLSRSRHLRYHTVLCFKSLNSMPLLSWHPIECCAFGLIQPCNPAVGGPAKSQLVHEVDAMGGEIGKMADRTYVQKRVLNRSKVHYANSHSQILSCC